VLTAGLDELLAGVDDAAVELGATDEGATDEAIIEDGAIEDAGVELGWLELLEDLEPPLPPPQATNPSVISDRQKTRFACFMVILSSMLWFIVVVNYTIWQIGCIPTLPELVCKVW
jgi:hypothetical protein